MHCRRAQEPRHGKGAPIEIPTGLEAELLILDAILDTENER